MLGEVLMKVSKVHKIGTFAGNSIPPLDAHDNYVVGINSLIVAFITTYNSATRGRSSLH